MAVRSVIIFCTKAKKLKMVFSSKKISEFGVPKPRSKNSYKKRDFSIHN